MRERLRRQLAGPGLGPVLVRASLGGGGVRVAGTAFGFLVGVQLARGLGAEGYGVYGLAMSVLSLLTVPVQFGFPPLVMRELAAGQVQGTLPRAAALLRWCRRRVLLSSAGLTVALGAAVLLTQDRAEPLPAALIAGLALVPAVALVNLYAAALRGLQRLVQGQLPDALLRPAFHSALLFAVAGLSLPLSPALAIGLGAVAAGLALAVAIPLVARQLPREDDPASAALAPATAWRAALPLALTQSLRLLQGHLVIVIMGLVSASAAIGLFQVARSIALAIAAPMALLNVIGMPVIARLHAAGDRARLQRLLATLALGMTATTIALSAPFWLIGPRLLGWVFGEAFASSSATVNVLSLGVVAMGTCGPSAALLNMTDHAGRVTRAAGLSVAVLAGASLALIPSGGDLGAAVAWSAAMTVWSLANAIDARRLLQLDTSLLSAWRVRT